MTVMRSKAVKDYFQRRGRGASAPLRGELRKQECATPDLRSPNQIATSEGMKRHWMKRRAEAAIARFDVELPLPPTMNNAYENMRPRRSKKTGKMITGRRKSDAYSAWKDAAAWAIAAAIPAEKKIGGAINVHILLPLKMRGDCDNRIKGVLDALVASGRIDDDRNIQWVSARKCLLGKDFALVKVEAA